MNHDMNQEALKSPSISISTSLSTKIKLVIIASFMLFIGFITGVFLLMISAIMLPFAAVKLWFLQKTFNDTIQANHNTHTRATDSEKASHGQVFEGEYVSE